jgi:hypothetical protein
MLNVGVIGNTGTLEPFVNGFKENVNINVIGKVSVGVAAKMDSFHYSIPELNRIELIERADVIIIDNSPLMPFKILSEIVKKSKHVFCAGYLNLTIDECTQIVKLANESGSVVQVSNPFFFKPEVQWLNNNISSPVYLDILDFTNISNHDNLLFPIILMLIELTGISPRKVGAVTFNSNPNNSDFTNIRLEFGDASVVNISYGTIETLEEFKIRVYSRNQFINLNFTRGTSICNNLPIDLSAYSNINEFDHFIDTIQSNARKKSCIEDYLIAMNLVQKINKKITQFFAQ